MSIRQRLALTLDNVNLPNLNVDADKNQVGDVLRIVFGIIGVVAIIYMILAGLKFINSRGNPEAVAAARLSVIYGAIGLVIAVSAQLVVAFVLGSL